MTIATGSRALASDVIAALGAKVSSAGGDVSATNATLAIIARTVAAILGDTPRLADYLAAGQTQAQLETGAIDCAPVFAAAAAANPGGRVTVPPGVYWWNSAVTFTTCCLFVGAGWNERNGGGASPSAMPEQGTWIKITNPAINPITLSGSGAAGRAGFVNVAFEQSHPAPATGWAPTVYPPVVTISNTGGQVLLDGINWWGIYDAVAVLGSAGTGGRVVLDNFFGQVFNTVFSGTNILDMVYAPLWHMWPLWSTNAGVIGWSQANATAVILSRCDGWHSGSLFFLYFKEAVRLQSDSYGCTTNFKSAHFYTDGCGVGLRITGNNTTATIGAFTFSGESVAGPAIAGSNAYRDEASGTIVAIGNLASEISGGSAVSLTAAAGSANLRIASASVANFNSDNSGAAGFSIATSSSVSRIDLATPPEITGSNNGGAIAAANGNIITNVWQSFTPLVYGSTVAGTPVTAAPTMGQFLVTGNMVTCQGVINLSSLTRATGNAMLGGFPFQTSTVGVAGEGTVSQMAGMTLTTGYTSLTLTLPPGQSYAQILESGSGLSTVPLPASALSTGIALSFQTTQRLF